MGFITPSLRLDNTVRVRYGASIKGLHQVHAYVKASSNAEKLATLLGMMDRLPMTRSEVFFRDVGSARWVATQLGHTSDMSVSVLSHDATEGRQQESVARLRLHLSFFFFLFFFGDVFILRTKRL